MRKTFSKVIEAGRHTTGEIATEPGTPYGAFNVRCPLTSTWLMIIAGDATAWIKYGMAGDPWEHVSVSTVQRVPTWEEMCWVKEQFFEDEECVIQYHPPKSQYINDHPNVLHLWLPVGVEIPLPPAECV